MARYLNLFMNYSCNVLGPSLHSSRTASGTVPENFLKFLLFLEYSVKFFWAQICRTLFLNNSPANLNELKNYKKKHSKIIAKLIHCSFLAQFENEMSPILVLILFGLILYVPYTCAERSFLYTGTLFSYPVIVF